MAGARALWRACDVGDEVPVVPHGEGAGRAQVEDHRALGEGLEGGGKDVTSESVIPAAARFSGIMDSRDAVVVAQAQKMAAE